MTELNAGRTARRDLAIWDAIDTYHNGPKAHQLDHDGWQPARTLVDLDRRLRLEQDAEAGYLPQTLEGCVQVLQTAALIAETLGPFVA